MILDGGLGLELERRGMRFTTALWSAEALLTQPQLLLTIHRDFLSAGANVLETATYQLSHAKLRELNYDEAAIDAVFALAVDLAREAIAVHRSSAGNGDYLVAGSMGPFGATLGDGSEYSGATHLADDELYAFHRERLQALIRAKPDVYFFETIPTGAEALVVASVARDMAVGPIWLALSSPDGEQTYDGTALTDIAAQLDAFACLAVIGINCTKPSVIARAVRALQQSTAKPIVICANLGQHWEKPTHGLTGGGDAAEFLHYVPEWLALGVSHIGGCCGVDPDTIADLATIIAHTRSTANSTHKTSPLDQHA